MGLAEAIKVEYNEAIARHVTQREADRIANTVTAAAAEITSRWDLGEKPRSDWFPENGAATETAREIFEGVLVAAQKASEERKLPFFGYLLASLAFSDVDRPTANMLIRLASSLSYRQLGMIMLLDQAKRFELRQAHYRAEGTTDADVPPELEPLLFEIMELHAAGIVARGDDVFLMDISDIDPSQMPLRGVGKLLFEHMKLERFPTEDIRGDIDQLKR